MTVIAITHALGALGPEICHILAARLRLRHVPYTLVEIRDVAPDASDTMLQRIVTDHARRRVSSCRPGCEVRSSPVAMTELEILEHAIAGDVILDGFGAGILLAPAPHVIRVRICAPMPERVHRVMHRMNVMDEAAAEAILEAADAHTVRDGQRLFGARAESPYLYELVLNSARLDALACAEQIVSLVTATRHLATISALRTLEDLHLEAQARVARYAAGEADGDDKQSLGDEPAEGGRAQLHEPQNGSTGRDRRQQ